MASEIRWKVIATLPRSAYTAVEAESLLFNVAPNPGVFTQFGVSLQYSYVPLKLTPTITFHQVMATLLREHGIGVNEKKFPYHLDLPGVGVVAVSTQCRLFLPAFLVVSVTVKADSDVLGLEPDDELFGLRRIDSLSPVAEVLRASLALAASRNHKAIAAPPSHKSFVGVHVRHMADGPDFQAWWLQNRERLVGFLIGNTGYHSMSADVVDSIEGKNVELNKKSSQERMLFDKQGLLHVSVSGQSDGENRQRFVRAMDLVELALVFGRFLDVYPSNRSQNEDFLDYMFSRIRAWITQPHAVFSASYAHRLLWQQIAREFSLVERVEIVTTGHPWLIDRLAERAEYLNEIAQEWWLGEEYATAFSSTQRATVDLELSFIDDLDVRRSVASDILEADRSLKVHNFKAAVVMAGAASEALLLAALARRFPAQARALQRQALSDYVELARQCNLIADGPLLDLIDNTLREWRNLVHPGRERRLGVSLDEHRAQIAVIATKALASALRSMNP